MNKPENNQALSLSAAWVASLLNLFPGLGTGYIYQRRWKAYWLTFAISGLWVLLGSYTELVTFDPSDPIQQSDDQTIVLGLFIISLVTVVEAWYTVKRSQENNLIP